MNLKKSDPKVSSIIQNELIRQKDELNMIPSENYCSRAVLEASGSIFTNKYAEGYPNERYYQGNRHVDEIENLAIERAKELFRAEHANVQPHSGSQANMAAYFAFLKPGDKVLAMGLNHGGHLTHGSPWNFSGRIYNFFEYGLDRETEMLDMDKIRKLAEKEKPKLILSGYTAYPRTVPFGEFHEIAKDVGAYSMADVAHIAGLIAGGAHPSPLPFTDVVTTTTHKTLRGPRSALILCKKKFARKIDLGVFPGIQGGPHEHTIAAKAVSFKEAMKPEFKDYSKQIVNNAKVLAETLMENGIKLVSNGTDNHLILIDLKRTESVGKDGMGIRVAVALEEAGIVTNANTIPFGTGDPLNPCGVRIGTPVLTTRGMKESEMKSIGLWIARVIEKMENKEIVRKTKENVKELCDNFPFY